MDDTLRTHVARYRTAMSIIREMVSAGILTEKDYAEIDTMMTSFFSLNLYTIFR